MIAANLYKMKKSLLVILLLLSAGLVIAQPTKKPVKQPTSQPDMNKLLEDAMKAEGMSKEEQEEMKKVMKDVMPALNEVNSKTADYPEFTNNKLLVPKKDATRITAMSKKGLAKAEVAGYANGLYAKMMAKGDPAEMTIVKKVVAMTPKAADINGAAVLAMLQGHPQAAMALSIKAVATDPTNLSYQNNMGALLTSYGYPEQAMPVLKKLKNDLPGNSTILNNIGHAWLSAGQLDSAGRYFNASVRSNPQHHESQTGKGLVEESKGDHEKASKTYEEAMHTSPNPFIDKMLKNKKGQKGTEELDFEKIKRNLTIYEYFPKDWMPKLPVLRNDVRYYNEDYGMIKGYQEMIRELGDKINDMTTTLGRELDELTNKGEETFIKEMSEANMKGLSFMSKPATVVLGVLTAYTKKWHLDYVDTLKKIAEWKFDLEKKRKAQIDAIYKQIADSKGTTCEQFKGQLDKIENDFMKQVNTRFRELLVIKAEEYRQWLNAWCTWSWYVTGNIKNVILMQDIGFTQYLAEMYTQIVTSMEVKPEHCSPPVFDVKEKIDPPQIPNFACPAVVSIPVGAEWEGLVVAAKDFDKNKYQIKKTDKPVPNVSVAYGTSDMVAQPGMAPSIKTAEGTIIPVTISYEEDGNELVPLTPLGKNDHESAEAGGREHIANEVEVDDDLVGLPAYLGQERDAKQEREKAKSKHLKDLLSKLMQADCSGVRNTKDILKDEIAKKIKEMKEEAEMKRIDEQIRAFKENRPKELVDDALWAYRNFVKDNNPANFNKNLKEMTDIFDKIAKYYPDRMQDVEDGMRVMNQLHDKIMRQKMGPQVYQEISDSGIQPSISSGVQAPGTFTTNKTLFQ
jgi:Tfp pilus assembly protein PilF